MGSKKRLIVVMATSDITIQLVLRTQILYMKGEGYEIRGLCSAEEYSEKLLAEGFPLDTIPMKREISPFHDIVSFFRLFAYFLKTKPALVFTHTPKAGLIGPVAARLAGVPCVVHVIFGYLIHDQAPKMMKILGWIMEKHTALWSHFCLSQSREDIRKAQFYKIIGKRCIKYIGNGINLKDFNPEDIGKTERDGLRASLQIPSAAFVVGFVGRLVREKGVIELFSAIPSVCVKTPHVHFLIVGPVEESQSDSITREEIELIRSKYPVTFTGFSDDIRKLLSIMDLFVLPSYREGVPRAMMEAAAMRIPCVASDIRGCRELIVPHKTGWLIKVRSACALGEGISHAASLSREQLLEIGINAQKHVTAHFDQKRVFRRFKRICDILLKRVGGP